MRKKFLLCLAALLALWGVGTTAAAAPAPGLGSYLQVTGYDPQTDYMDAMDERKGLWFEALTAVLVQKMWGGEAALTPRSGDLGADVAVWGGHCNAIIQCKCHAHVFSEGRAVMEPYTALLEYNRKSSVQFSRAVLAVNAPNVSGTVRERARANNVLLWDRDELKRLLAEYTVRYGEVEAMLGKGRLESLY